MVRAYEITSSNAPTVNYGDIGGTAKLNIIGARIKAAGSSANGRTIMFSAAASDAVRLANCFLIASGDYSIYSDTANTRVHLINGTAANKDKNGNITHIGGDWNYNPNLVA